MSKAREHILTRLGMSQTPVSGDDLASELGLSRAGIWKHIQILKKNGIAIEAQPGKGYVLNSEIFSAGLLKAQLSTRRIGKQIMILEETGSTNQDAMQQAEKGAEEGLVIFANRQLHGKGRLGRIWHTMPASLAASILLRPDLPPEQVPQLSLLTAVALHEVLSRYAPDIRIKWPNDLLHNGKKVAGILTEMRAEPGRVHTVVLGFGINLTAPADGWPSDINKPATDLTTISTSTASKTELAIAILNAVDQWYDIYLQHGFAPVHRAWWQAHAASGARVSVYDGRQYIEGTATALDDDGALLLDTGNGVKRIIAGDLELLS
ncbi:MAG: biotin--[acetyl-CoA-carboxylase] ligase [Mariprofundus sp.]|nr:biotin--[acetyl-CoA-carboxylase] ligase [Mariprofundus sp.]